MPRTLFALVVSLGVCSLARNGNGLPPAIDPSSPRAQAFLDTLERRTFNFFWERSDPQTGLTRDRWPTLKFSSIAAVGFALTAYPIGAERGFVTRTEAANRALATLRWFWQAPQGPGATGTSGYRGFFYHFLDLQSGLRFQTVELSTIDTALLLGGVLFCREYFNGSDSSETAVRAYADSLYRRVDWSWAQRTPPLINMAWTPESGWHPLDWRGDYFENSRRATLAQRAYASANPDQWSGYGPDVWGLSASDGPADVTLMVNGSPRRFFSYAARGASFTEVRDDGTIAPTAAGGAVAFAPEIAIPALIAMRERYGEWLFGTYGFFDAFNPTFRFAGQASAGRVVSGQGWFDTDYLGIDQGPILAMIANYRDDLVWRYMRHSPYVITGLKRAGFAGGWLD